MHILTHISFVVAEEEDTPPIQCYLQCVSPIKKSGGYTYFNCELQTESGITQAVCFDSERKTTFDSLAEHKKPSKDKEIQNQH